VAGGWEEGGVCLGMADVTAWAFAFRCGWNWQSELLERCSEAVR